MYLNEMEEKSRRAEYSEATRRALIDGARELFTEKGYADTPTEEIVRRARVSRGALYHHFPDKRGLFRAVLEEVDTQLMEMIAARGLIQEDVWQGVVNGVDAYLDACFDPAYQRIVLLDGPAVMGWSEWREIGEEHGLGLIRFVLEKAMSEGVVETQPIEPLASMLHAALNEAGMHIATAKNPKSARREVGKSVFSLIEGLRKK
jgi:AcrR family transcriptional regulator